jgi:hypothetical protein
MGRHLAEITLDSGQLQGNCSILAGQPPASEIWHELRGAMKEFEEWYNNFWVVGKNGSLSPLQVWEAWMVLSVMQLVVYGGNAQYSIIQNENGPSLPFGIVEHGPEYPTG